MTVIALGAALGRAQPAWASTEISLLEPGSHCVAYKAQSTMFLFKSGAVIGRNCDVSAQVLPELAGLYRIEVNIPLRGFQSGDTSRDQDVMKTLKADVRPELLFRSKALPATAWRELFAKTDFVIEGDLLIGEKTFPLKINAHYQQTTENVEIDGKALVRFNDFNIEPPTVGAGIVAKTKPELELHVHLLGSRILGADSIRLNQKEEAMTK